VTLKPTTSIARRRKITVTLGQNAVDTIDRWVAEGRYPNRSFVLQRAVNILIERDMRNRLIQELAKLQPEEERRFAEEILGDEPWPEFR
jgi:Arc/MetJ-type ribon-helix-helix transcriptional regulator